MASPKTLYEIFNEIFNTGELQEFSLRQAFEGADPNTLGAGGCTRLMIALLRNRTEVVSLLLSHPEIKINAKSKSGDTALHYVCFNGSTDSLNLLLALPGLELNERDSAGKTPVMEAIHWGHSEAVRALTQKTGVDLDLKTAGGKTLEEFAAR